MIDQSRVKSGFDVEALLGERYLTYVLLTALDSGLVPIRTEIADPHLVLNVLERSSTDRLYEPLPLPDGTFPGQAVEAFDVEILTDHPSLADLRVKVVLAIEQVGGQTFPFVPLDLFLTLRVPQETAPEGGLIAAGLEIRVVDFDSPLLPIIEAPPISIPKAVLLERIQSLVDRTVDIGGASNFKRVEAITLHKLRAEDGNPAALGAYVNVRLRTGDEETSFKEARGDVGQAVNFLPDGEDIAFASRPGLYADLGKDAFHRTAFKNDLGEFEHALRPNLFNPKSKRIGTIHGISVGQMTVNGIPQNGLRIMVHAEYEPDPDVNPDVDITIDIMPKIGDDGLLHWSVDLDVSVDALFEFLTLIGFAFLSIMFGGFAGLLFLGLIAAGEIGAGIYLEHRFQEKVANRADATLTDVILDRLKVKRRRWDPFFTTLHEVVIRPSQAIINDKGILLAGKAVVGREAEILDSVVIRDEFRDTDFTLTGLRYRVDDFAEIHEDLAGYARGMIRRDFAQSADDEPGLFDLTLEQIQQRFDDPEGPFLMRNIPYFLARVHLFEHEIERILCLSGREVKAVQDQLRNAFGDRKYAEIVANEGDAIRAQVIADLSAGGATPTEEEIAAEVEARIQGRLGEIMRGYDDPTALRLANELKPLLRFDASPVELADLRDRHILTLDEIDTVQERLIVHRHRRYLRDHPDWEPGPGGEEDNLLNRPRYRPTPQGPEFP